MMVGLAMATTVESTMIMKKPIIIAHSAFHGFSRRTSPGDRGVGVVICPHLVSAPDDAVSDYPGWGNLWPSRGPGSRKHRCSARV